MKDYENGDVVRRTGEIFSRGIVCRCGIRRGKQIVLVRWLKPNGSWSHDDREPMDASKVVPFGAPLTVDEQEQWTEWARSQLREVVKS